MGAAGLSVPGASRRRGRAAPGAEGVQNLETERRHLAEADRDIAAGERCVTTQALLVERLRGAGHDTGEAERLLLTLRQTLEAWWGHRELILDEISRLERAGPW